MILPVVRACFISFVLRAHRTSLYVGGCSIILIGRTAWITAPHRARLWERVEVVLTFWKMAAARALSSSMTSPRNRLLRTVAASATTHTRPMDLVRPPDGIFGAVRMRLYGLIHVVG